MVDFLPEKQSVGGAPLGGADNASRDGPAGFAGPSYPGKARRQNSDGFDRGPDQPPGRATGQAVFLLPNAARLCDQGRLAAGCRKAMTAQHDHEGPSGRPQPAGRQPVFNLPPSVTFIAMLLVAIHAIRVILLTPVQDRFVVLTFGFIPARYGELGQGLPVPEAAWWSPLTYALLHGDWVHVGVNVAWFLAFASPVARRLGASRLLAICAISALGGAGAHYLSHPGGVSLLVGASAAVAGLMAAASRFAFSAPSGRMSDPHAPALSLIESFSNPRFLAFFGVWLVVNFIFGSGVVPIAGDGVAIAWQAHVGGFIAGLLAFSLLARR